MKPARAGIVDLRDLAGRYAWDELAIARVVAAAGLVPGGPARVAFAPPSVLLVVVPFDSPEMFVRSRAWLADARHVLVLRDHARPVEEAELAAHLEEEWQAAASSLGATVELHDAHGEVDIVAAVTRARVRAAEEPPEPAAGPPPEAALVEHPPGPSFEVVRPTAYRQQLDALLACQVTAGGAGPLLHTGDGVVSLGAPPAGPVRLVLADGECALLPDGRRLVRSARGQWRVGDAAFEAQGVRALGFDPRHPVGWTGFRMMCFWLYTGRREVGFLSASDHDFPCGPAKKLYGHLNNEPHRVQLAPDLSIVSYHFGRDVLVTSALPVAWRAAGPVDVADFPRDPARAVFFVHREAGQVTTDLLDEDARDAPPPLVLGPSPQARYAVGLDEPVVRITGCGPGEGVATRVGGPGGGFAVFDAEHREVRRSADRLLGGAWRHATVWDGTTVWREDLATGARRPIVALERAPVCTVPVAGTANVLVAFEHGDRLLARLI